MEQEGAKGYKKLRAWQKADKLAIAIFQAMHAPPHKPRWLVDQVTRASVSVPANIAEGYSRSALGDYLRFLDIARGSLAEVEYYLHFMSETSLLDTPVMAKLNELQTETGNLLFGLLRSLGQKQRSGAWDRSHLVRDDPSRYKADEAASIELLEVFVDGRPPLHEAASGISLSNPQHGSYKRAELLKQKAQERMGGHQPRSEELALEIENARWQPQADVSNIIQAMFSTLEGVVYQNDGQIREVHYTESQGVKDGYFVRLYTK